MKISVDRKVILWVKKFYEIPDEVIGDRNKLSEYVNECVQDSRYDIGVGLEGIEAGDVEYLYDSEEQLMPENNSGYSTIEVTNLSSDDYETLYTNGKE